MPASPADALTGEIPFPSDATLNLGTKRFDVTHVAPAHTDGDSFIQFVNANVVHTGDLGFNGMYPFIDYSTGGRSGWYGGGGKQTPDYLRQHHQNHSRSRPSNDDCTNSKRIEIC